MDVSAIANQGLQDAQRRLEKAAAQISEAFSPSDAQSPGDAIELSQGTVDMLNAQHQFESNLKVLQSADEMTKSTLDLLG
jgi:flagellar basal body rod protein FlgC